MKIKGGYYIKARQIQESFIMGCQPCVREIWDYLLREANHADRKVWGRTIKRGQLLRAYDDIREALHWKVGYRKMRYSENSTKHAMKTLRSTLMITTMRAPGGVLITVLNYDRYQNPSNYENAYESANVSPKRYLNVTQAFPPLYNKNDKNEKNGRIYNAEAEKTKFLDFVYLTAFEHESLKGRLGVQSLNIMLERLNDYIGQIGEVKAKSKYKSHYHVVLNWHRKDNPTLTQSQTRKL